MTPDNEKSNGDRGGIGTLNEHSLHADLIQYLTQPGDQLEADVGGYLADILRGETIIEVQTRNLSSLKKKIAAISKTYQVQIIHPVNQNKWITRKDKNGEPVSRRKSPKRGRVEEIFTELVRSWTLINSPNVSLTVLLIDAEEVWLDDGQGSWRRKYWSISERHLLKVHRTITFNTNHDFLQLLPANLPKPFTNKELAGKLGIRTSLAGKITYALRKMDVLHLVSKKGNQYQFEIKKDK
jgi:hypothetical protein